MTVCVTVTAVRSAGKHNNQERGKYKRNLSDWQGFLAMRRVREERTGLAARLTKSNTSKFGAKKK